MNKKLTLLVAILVSTILFAQSNYKDVIYLKNGSVIRGTIVEEIPNQSIKVKNRG